jgi:hypothetical protein
MRQEPTGPRADGGEDTMPCASVDDVRPFTARQGQYLAFIYYYTKIHGTQAVPRVR